MLITCSNCQSKIRVPDSAAGKKGKCPRCGTVIAIPATGEAAEEAPAEAPAETPPPPPEPVAEAPPAEEPARSPFDFSEPEPPPAPPKKASRKAAADEDEVVEEPEVEAYADEERPKTRKPVKESATLSLVSMILGILSLVCSCPTFVSWCVAPLPFVFAVAALVTGFLGMKQGGKGFAIAGMCCGGGGILLTIIMILVNIFVGVALFSVGAAGRH
jgi:predicted Zn finger-like uncharacterized protein